MSSKIDYQLIGARIRLIREEKGMTQEYVADRMGYSRGTYSRIERGESANPIQHLDALVSVIGTEILDIFPYNVSLYTNHRLLIYTLIFGKPYSRVAAAFGVSQVHIKRIMTKTKREYLLEYVAEIDELFPDLQKYEMFYNLFEPIGNNSLCFQMEDRNFVFMNVLGFSPRDTFVSLCEINEVHIQEYD